VRLLGKAEPLPHGGDGDAVDVVRRCRAVEGGEGGASQLGVRLVAGRREVVEVLVVAGDAKVGRGDRAQVDERLEVVLGDAVDLGRGSRVLRSVCGHLSERTPRP